MKKAVGLLVFYLLTLTIGLCAPAKAGRDIVVTAMLSSVTGSVEKKDEKTGKWKPLADGDTLEAGVKIRTAIGASCILRWPEGNAVRLESETLMSIAKMLLDPSAGTGVSVIELEQGRITAHSSWNVKNRFLMLKTPIMAADAPGALFAAEVSPSGASSLLCAQGICNVIGPHGNKMQLKQHQKAVFDKSSFSVFPKKMSSLDISRTMAVDGISNPELVIFDPTGDIAAGSEQITVRGRVRPGTAVSINGMPSQASERGFFASDILLSPGRNDITIVAKNSKGLETVARRTIKFGEDKPEYRPSEAVTDSPAVIQGRLHIASPGPGAVSREDSMPVSGATPGPATLSVNGKQFASISAPAVFSKRVPLEEGSNEISLVSTETGEAIRVSVVRDSTPPELNVLQPFNLFEEGAPGCTGPNTSLSCEVVGVTEPGAAVTVNNKRVEAGPDGMFRIDTRLSTTQSSIVVYSEDTAGNLAVQVLQRNYDPLKVVYLSVSVSPASIIANNINTSTVTVTARDLLGLPVTGTSVVLSATAGGTLATPVLTLSNGTASTVFQSGVGVVRNTVAITAVSGTVSATANLLLLPDTPPIFDE